MNVVFRSFNGSADWVWVNKQVGLVFCEDTGGIMAVNKDTDELVGACIMDNWTHNSVQSHFMISSPIVLRHGFVDLCFEYMFNGAGVSRVYGLVPANNKKAVKFNTHMGFTLKARMDEAFDVGVDYLLMEMKRENCRFINQLEAA